MMTLRDESYQLQLLRAATAATASDIIRNDNVSNITKPITTLKRVSSSVGGQKPTTKSRGKFRGLRLYRHRRRQRQISSGSYSREIVVTTAGGLEEENVANVPELFCDSFDVCLLWKTSLRK